MRDQKGLTFIEILAAILIISLSVAAMMKALDQTLKGQARARNDLRAATLLRSKLDMVKDHARQLALAGSFSKLSTAPVMVAASLTQQALVDNRAFTWSVTGTYMASAGSNAFTVSAATTKVFRLFGNVYWSEPGRMSVTSTAAGITRSVSQTVFISDPSQ